MKIAWNMLLPVKPLDSMLTSFGPIKFWTSCQENLHMRELIKKRKGVKNRNIFLPFLLGSFECFLPLQKRRSFFDLFILSIFITVLPATCGYLLPPTREFCSHLKFSR